MNVRRMTDYRFRSTETATAGVSPRLLRDSSAFGSPYSVFHARGAS